MSKAILLQDMERRKLLKKETFQMRISKDTREDLDRVAKHYNLSASATIDMLIAKETRLIDKQRLDIKNADNEDSKKNIDFDMFDFSKFSIDEKFWALVFFIFANCKDIEFIEKIKDKFNIDNEKLRQEMNI